MTITDDVALAGGAKHIILFRWHLGTAEAVDITFDGTRHAVLWPDAEIRFETNVPITVTQMKLPDNTLAGHDGTDDPKNVHVCIVVKTTDLCAEYFSTTHIVPR